MSNDYDVKPHEWINANQRFAPPPKRGPVIDVPLSKLVGRNIVMGSPEHHKAVRVIADWNRKRGPEDLRPNDYLENEEKVKEMK